MWEKSTTDILLMTPFLGRVLMSLDMVESETIPTTAVDGRYIYWNPAFVATLKDHERDAVRVHECLHVLLGHHVRRGSRDNVLWNIACDYEINPYVIEAGYTLPKGVLIDSQYKDLCAEEIYKILLDESNMCSTPQACKWGEVITVDETNLQKATDEWNKLSVSSLYGDTPDNIKIKIIENITPKIDIYSILLDYLTLHIPCGDESWLVKNRRYDLLPGEDFEIAGHVVVCIDTSGSMRKDDLNNILGYVLSIAEIGELDVILGDAKVQKIIRDVQGTEEITNIFSKLRGGGGTDFKPLIKAAEDHIPDVILYFTDGEGDFGRQPNTPIIWLLTQNIETPYGQRVILP